MTDSELEQVAIIAIRNYLNKDFTDLEIKTNYPLAIKRLMINTKNLENKMVGILSVNENSTAITYKDGVEFGVVTADIKALLPKPYLKMW